MYRRFRGQLRRLSRGQHEQPGPAERQRHRPVSRWPADVWRAASTKRLSSFFIVAGLLVLASSLGATLPAYSSSASTRTAANAPWYPSLEAFEHYDSGRSHVFSMARFGGSLHGPNTVDLVSSPQGAYPSGYNMSYLNASAAFIQGGSYGDAKGSIGPFVAKVNPTTLKPVWYTQLRNTVQAGEWDYPEAMAIENDGYIYVVSGYRIFKVNPASGKVMKTLVLPTQVYMRTNFPTNPPTYRVSRTTCAGGTRPS
jgi:hypothetical protein